VRDQRNGFLVPVKNAPALASALEKLIVDASLREKMGEQSRLIAVDHFSKEKINEAIIHVYNI
jgi:glycosyltransferase involved in cell wall biosynthesis